MRAQQQMFALAAGGEVLAIQYEGPVAEGELHESSNRQQKEKESSKAAAQKRCGEVNGPPLLGAMSMPPGSILAITDLQYGHFDRHLRCVQCHVRSPSGICYDLCIYMPTVCTHVYIHSYTQAYTIFISNIK